MNVKVLFSLRRSTKEECGNKHFVKNIHHILSKTIVSKLMVIFGFILLCLLKLTLCAFSLIFKSFCQGLGLCNKFVVLALSLLRVNHSLILLKYCYKSKKTFSRL